jgi:hypothetical protein
MQFGNSPTCSRNISPPASASKSKPSKKLTKAGSRLNLLFEPEEGSDTFLRNTGISLK